NALVAQKDKLIAEQKAEWEQLMAEVIRKQVNYLEQHRATAEEFDKELDELRTKHSEEYNALKVSLESEVEVSNNTVRLHQKFNTCLLYSLVSTKHPDSLSNLQEF
ncbi:unnamed protein product, partial [Dicrocoelium dendriticum]